MISNQHTHSGFILSIKFDQFNTGTLRLSNVIAPMIIYVSFFLYNNLLQKYRSCQSYGIFVVLSLLDIDAIAVKKFTAVTEH